MRSFEALADPTRRKIIAMLARKELAASAIAKRFDMTPSAISQHLNVLKEAKLVHMRIDAQKRIYRVNAKGVEKAEKWLRGISHPAKKTTPRKTSRKRAKRHLHKRNKAA